VVKRAWLAAAVILLQVAAAPEPPPTATMSDSAVRVVFPEHILRRAGVRKQLASALTTTFLVTARTRDIAEAKSRIEVRFDLWDEVYLVRRIELGRVVEQRKLASMNELLQWWQTPMHVLDVRAPRATLDLRLTILPFSTAEEGDAREWLSKSGGVGTEQSPADGVVGAMIGTTIQARPIATYRWSIEAR
jgi:hypothetical protein